jgi:hypothetical protein
MRRLLFGILVVVAAIVVVLLAILVAGQSGYFGQ